MSEDGKVYANGDNLRHSVTYDGTSSNRWADGRRGRVTGRPVSLPFLWAPPGEKCADRKNSADRADRADRADLADRTDRADRSDRADRFRISDRALIALIDVSLWVGVLIALIALIASASLIAMVDFVRHLLTDRGTTKSPGGKPIPHVYFHGGGADRRKRLRSADRADR